MRIYHYHPVTGEFLHDGFADECQVVPGDYIIPACATTVAPPAAPENHVTVFNGTSWQFIEIAASVPPEVPPPTVADIVAERSRRLAAGFDYDFGDVRGVHRIGTTESDMAGWSEVTMLANALIETGLASQVITVSTDTGAVGLTATEWQAVLLAAGAFRQPFWQASFILQQMDPIPVDYTADTYWP